MATFAMECNKHVAIEVPAAMSVEECWQLVDTAEKTRRHCIMLENCCYDPFALMTLNMAQRGLFGEIMHVEGAYIHDLRSMYFAEESEGGYHNHWGKRYSIEHTGNPYPTHGLGPACQILDIHRSDRMEYLVSMSHSSGRNERVCPQTIRRIFTGSPPEISIGRRKHHSYPHAQRGRQSCFNTTYPPHVLTAAFKQYAALGFAQKYPVPCIALDLMETLHLKENC